MGKYKEGQLLTVTLKNVKVTDSMYDTSFRGVNSHVQYSARADKVANEMYFDSFYEDVIIEKAEEVFKPKIGDVYRVGSDIYYVRKWSSSSGTIVIENGHGSSFSDDKYNFSDEIAKFQLMNPKLIVRDGKEVPQEDYELLRKEYELNARSHW